MVTQILSIAGLLLTGGIFGKIIDTFFLSKKDKVSANEKLINQLQELVFKLQDLVLSNINRQNDLQKDVDYWRREYNELHKENQNNQAEKESLKKQVENFKKQMEHLNKQYNDLKSKYDQLIKIQNT
jgi:chromosome segregation ATPase